MESTRYRVYLYGQEESNKQLVVHEPPAYRSLYITDAAVDENGHLILTFSDDSTIDSGLVRGPTGSIGPRGADGKPITWRGDYVNGTTYSYLDCVTHNGDVYVYISSTASSAAVTDTTKWDLMLKRGEPGADGTDGVTFTPAVSADGTLSWSNNAGAQNPPSVNIKGEPGAGFKVLGYYTTYANLTSNVKSPSGGDAYGVGSGEPYDIYIWDGVNKRWVNNGALQGVSGEDGITPTIGSNGNWFLGTTDTGKPSRGQTGADGAPGKDGKDVTSFIVNATFSVTTGDDGGVTIDKTFNEIITAYNNGNRLIAHVKTSSQSADIYEIPCVYYNASQSCVFGAVFVKDPNSPSTSTFALQLTIPKSGSASGNFDSMLQLPAVSATDNGKILQVTNGAWDKAQQQSYSSFGGATSSAAGTSGLVPAPDSGSQGKYLKADGTWADLPAAGTGSRGVTYLVNDVTKTDTDKAATAKSVNDVYKLAKPEKVSKSGVSGAISVTVADNTEYSCLLVTSLTLEYPSGDFECWMKIGTASSGDISITFPSTTKYIGSAPTFSNGETWEVSIKNKVVVAGKIS